MRTEHHESATAAIHRLVDEETKAWDAKDVGRLLALFHPDMVWPFPPTAMDHDPCTWVFELGRFCPIRWRESWSALFDSHDLIHNRRETVKVLPTHEGDGGMAVVDVDTLWRDKETGADFHWEGRAAKLYTRTQSGWRMIAHHGLHHFPPVADR
jgi:ketosteroid isomerase-like protein